MHQNNLKVDGYIIDDIEQTIGINDRITLAYASSLMQERVNNYHMLNGVTIIDPRSTYIAPDVRIGEDSIIYPNTTIMGNCSIGSDCEIGPDSYLENTVILDRSIIKYSYLTDTNIKNDVQIGPYARMRSNVIVEDKAKIGNFVELKNTTFGQGSKAAHLTYLGDTTLGKDVNIGCGVITVNYDGINKYKTSIDDGSFIGCNSNIIAPVIIGQRSFIAAGTTVTDDVPENSFAIGRARQVTKEHYMKTQKK
jgi:bifunctional UDP-N-acetylglucosamine pyrophosphorylase/glucosamine-1-phosphate N-acetyltransferase